MKPPFAYKQELILYLSCEIEQVLQEFCASGPVLSAQGVFSVCC